MPEIVTCPSCNTTLKPKTPVPAGTRIKCPKCQTVFAVPGDDEVASAPAPRPAQPRAADQREEPDDFAAMAGEPGDAEPTGRRGAGAPKKGGVPLWVWLVGGGGALIVVCCGGCGILSLLAPGLLGIQTGAESASVSPANFDQIKKDMTEAQVKAIMGPTTLSGGLGGVKVDTWQKGADIISVGFQNDKAMQRSSQIGGVKKEGW